MLLSLLALAFVFLVEAIATHRSPPGNASQLRPVFSPPPGYYADDLSFTIQSPVAAAEVIYTLDGHTPTPDVALRYTHPIRLQRANSSVTIVQARLLFPDGQMGPVVYGTYFVGTNSATNSATNLGTNSATDSKPDTLPLMSLIVDGDDWEGAERGIYTHPQARGRTWERPVYITYVDADRRHGFDVQAGIRIHGDEDRTLPKTSFRLYFRRSMGTASLTYPLFPDSDVQSFQRLVLSGGGQDYAATLTWPWTLLRTPLADRLMRAMGEEAIHSRPVSLFINGKPWGIYWLRERPDEDWFANHYGMPSVDLLEFSPDGEVRVVAGERTAWDHLVTFIAQHDMTDAGNYAYVETQLDIENWIDTLLLRLYAADATWPNDDWLLFRPRIAGGRWQWLLREAERYFGAPPTTAETDTPAQVLSSEGWDARIFRRLLENSTFRLHFLRRAMILLHTTLSAPSVTAQIDALAAEIAPAIPVESARWPSVNDWDAQVQALRDFACRRPDTIRNQLVAHLGLEGTVHLTFEPPDDGRGTVAVEGIVMHAPISDTAWQLVAFRHVPLQVTAVPTPGYRFVGWVQPELPSHPVITWTPDANQTFTPRFEPLAAAAPRPGDVVFTPAADDSFELIELMVTRPAGIDMRGWRITDNDTKTATDEGSLIFPSSSALAHVSAGTRIQIVLRPSLKGMPLRDDLQAWDRRMTLYVAGGHLDVETDPGFAWGEQDNLVLLAPGPTDAFSDDIGIAFVSHHTAVTPASFGILSDGVWPED